MAPILGAVYSVPPSVEQLRVRTCLRFRRTRMFQRLNNHRFWETANCILVEMGEAATRSTRRFIRFSDNTICRSINSSIVIHTLQHLGSRSARVMRLTSIASGASQARKDR